MGMTVGIKSSGNRHLDLHFRGSNEDGKGHWGSLHIAICVMHEERQPVQSIACELDHADIDKLIQELQAAKALLVPDDSGQVWVSMKDPAAWRVTDLVDLGPGHSKSKYRRLVGSEWTECDEHGKLFETTPPIEPDAVCWSCGFKYGEHSYSEFCIDRLPDSMRRFSRTRKFTP